jgi:1,4-alpha-glucan branching enzyme
MVSVQFRYLTGLKRQIFRDARILGSWDQAGRLSQGWSEVAMAEITTEDGCPAFTTTVQLAESEVGKTFHWSVRVTTPSVTDVSGVPTEINDGSRSDRVRTFKLRSATDNPSHVRLRSTTSLPRGDSARGRCSMQVFRANQACASRYGRQTLGR